MKRITVVIPSIDDAGDLGGSAIITEVASIGPVMTAKAVVSGIINVSSSTRLPGPKGDKGDPGARGPGILSNITRITASTNPPADPEVNDLWIDLT